MDDLSPMLGKRIVVDITYLAPDGGFDGSVEYTGTVTEIDPLVSIDVDGVGRTITLPPKPDEFVPTDDRSCDYSASWTVQASED